MACMLNSLILFLYEQYRLVIWTALNVCDNIYYRNYFWDGVVELAKFYEFYDKVGCVWTIGCDWVINLERLYLMKLKTKNR